MPQVIYLGNSVFNSLTESFQNIYQYSRSADDFMHDGEIHWENMHVSIVELLCSWQLISATI